MDGRLPRHSRDSLRTPPRKEDCPFRAEVYGPETREWLLVKWCGAHHVASAAARDASRDGGTARVWNVSMQLATVTFRNGTASGV